MSKLISVLAAALMLLASVSQAFRPPAVPLIVQDPYVSIWSMSDNLYDGWPMHWAGGVSALAGMIRVDGTCYTFMGQLGMSGGVCNNKIPQTNLVVSPTQTVYTFRGAGVQLIVNFTTPAILNDVSYLMQPGSYITLIVTSIDSQNHQVQLYYDNSGEVAVNSASEQITWGMSAQKQITTLQIGTKEQKFNGDKNSDRINWGYWYVSVQTDSATTTTVASDVAARGAFASGNALPPFDTNQPRPCSQNWPVLAVKFDLGTITPSQQYRKFIGISYDQVYVMSYFGTLLKPYWTQYYANISSFQLKFMSEETYQNIESTCSYFDHVILGDMKKVVSSPDAQNQYATLGGLAYRQVTGSLALAWNHVAQDWWVFMKEISSDGDVSTVDVIYPASPLLLYMNPTLYTKLVLPLMVYANNETKPYGQQILYNLAWAPHHLGVWPICDLKPEHQEQMPIEETANMMHLIQFLIEQGHFPDYEHYWSLLRIWGKYLTDSLPDPGNQLCTDDFEGPSPHNSNLALKGIVGLTSWSRILRIHQDYAESASVYQIAQSYAAYWLQHAIDGDHYKLEYDKSNTWSLKYNLYFQYVFNMNIFPQSVTTMELNFYLGKHLNKYGIPLDNRATFTKLDWEFWIGAIATEQQFETIIKAVYDFANESKTRVPLTDWYETINPVQKGFRARPVVGGIWSKVLLAQQQNQLGSQLQQPSDAKEPAKFLAMVQ